MSRIGIILVGYNMEEYVTPCLDAWIRARAQRLGGHEFVICAVSLPFAGFPNEGPDSTADILKMHLDLGQIDHLITEPKNIPETTARGMALHWLSDQDCDVSWMVDLDEFYTTHDIQQILEFVGDNPWVDWFRLSLKNYVFDDKTYLIEPFQPPRIHRMRVADGQYQAHSFSADNDIAYGGSVTRDLISQDQFASLVVPPSVAWIRHMTWQQGDRARRKIEYQLKGRNWPQCSFAWDEVKGLVFNPGLPVPKVARDES